MSSSSSSSKGKEPVHTEEEETAAAAAAGEEEDTGAEVAPIVKLEAVAVSTGEEDEHAILDLKAKLYRFDKDGNQWKERGAGSVKLLKHNETNKVRLVMRQSKTLKICANHRVLPTMSVQEHAGNDKSCVWQAADFSDGELKDELFCIRFASVDNCRQFMKTVQQVAGSQLDKENGVTVSQQDKEENGVSKSQQAVENKVGESQQDENEDASNAAQLLKNLSVEDRAQKGESESKSEVKKEESPASST